MPEKLREIENTRYKLPRCAKIKYPRSQKRSRLEHLQTGDSKLSIHRLKIDGLCRLACHQLSSRQVHHSHSHSHFRQLLNALNLSSRVLSRSRSSCHAPAPPGSHTLCLGGDSKSVWAHRLLHRLRTFPRSREHFATASSIAPFRLCQSGDASFSHRHHNSPCQPTPSLLGGINPA